MKSPRTTLPCPFYLLLFLLSSPPNLSLSPSLSLASRDVITNGDSTAVLSWGTYEKFMSRRHEERQCMEMNEMNDPSQHSAFGFASHEYIEKQRGNERNQLCRRFVFVNGKFGIYFTLKRCNNSFVEYFDTTARNFIRFPLHTFLK